MLHSLSQMSCSFFLFLISSSFLFSFSTDHIPADHFHFPTSRQEVESHFLIPTELLGLGILLLGVLLLGLLLLLGVLLPEPPPSDSLGLPLLPGSRGAESFGFGGTFGLGGAMLLQLLVLWLKRPGGELPSLFIGGWWGVVEEQGVERPEDGRDRSLLTGIRLDFVPTPPPPPSPHSLILLLLLLTQYNIHSLNCREQPARACWSSRSLVMFARRGSSRYWRLHWRLDAARAPWSRHSMLPEKPGRAAPSLPTTSSLPAGELATFHPWVNSENATY